MRSAVPREAPQPKKAPLPTLADTILLGLPKVATQGQSRAAEKPKTAKEALVQKLAAQPKPEKAAKVETPLDAKWIGAGASDASKALVNSGDAAERLVEAWLDKKNHEALFAAGQDEALTGVARKASRRALNVLKARGVSAPEKVQIAPKSQTEETIIEATTTLPDGRGSFSITIAKRQGGNRAHIAEVIMREDVGVVQAVSGWMSRSQIKEAHQRIAESAGIAPINVPIEWARHRIAETLKLNEKSGVLVPLGLERCKELTEPAPATPPAHPIGDLESALGDETTIPTNALHAEPEFRGWIAEGRALEEMLENVGKALNEEESKDSAKVDAALQAELKLATDRYFTPELRKKVADRMRDAALSVRQRLGDAKAKEVLLGARAIEQAGLITSPPSDIEFLRGFFQKALSILAQRGGGQLRIPNKQ